MRLVSSPLVCAPHNWHMEKCSSSLPFLSSYFLTTLCRTFPHPPLLELSVVVVRRRSSWQTDGTRNCSPCVSPGVHPRGACVCVSLGLWPQKVVVKVLVFENRASGGICAFWACSLRPSPDCEREWGFVSVLSREFLGFVRYACFMLVCVLVYMYLRGGGSCYFNSPTPTSVAIIRLYVDLSTWVFTYMIIDIVYSHQIFGIWLLYVLLLRWIPLLLERLLRRTNKQYQHFFTWT